MAEFVSSFTDTSVLEGVYRLTSNKFQSVYAYTYMFDLGGIGLILIAFKSESRNNTFI